MDKAKQFVISQQKVDKTRILKHKIVTNIIEIYIDDSSAEDHQSNFSTRKHFWRQRKQFFDVKTFLTSNLFLTSLRADPINDNVDGNLYKVETSTKGLMQLLSDI